MQIRKIILSLNCLLPLICFAANHLSSAPIKMKKHESVCIPGKPETSNHYFALKWYRDSAERNAQYNQVFTIGLEKIKEQLLTKKLKPQTWGVIFDIDETVLDNMQYEKDTVVLGCSPFSWNTWVAFLKKESSIATPGAVRATCGIKKIGGNVVLVTNRDGNFDNGIKEATVNNLKKVGICFDSVVFATSTTDNNKTPRFNAIIAGDYSKILATKKLKPMQILAYFGDNIQDFPNITQANAIKQDPNGEFYKQFGQTYFSLPNPIYGSWLKNKFN